MTTREDLGIVEGAEIQLPGFDVTLQPFATDDAPVRVRLDVVAPRRAPRRRQRRHVREQRQIPIDDQPALAAGKTSREITEIGASAGGQIEHVHRLSANDLACDRVCQARRARGGIGTLAQPQPAR